MSYWITIKIDGHDIIFTDDHVGFNDSIDLDDDSAISALKIAQKINPIISIAESLYANAYQFSVGKIDWRIIPRETIEDFLNIVERATDSHLELVPPETREVIAQALACKRNGYTPEPITREAKSQTSGGVDGYVYLIKSTTGYYKIGRTINPDDRIATFSVKLPFEVEYEHTIHTDDMYGLERTLHQQFADKRVNGEWFDLSADDVAYIKSLGGA